MSFVQKLSRAAARGIGGNHVLMTGVTLTGFLAASSAVDLPLYGWIRAPMPFRIRRKI